MKQTAERVLNWIDQFFNGRLILGNATAPSSGMQLTVAGDVGPEASGTRSFGSTVLRWAAAWFTGNVSIGPVSSGNAALLHTTANSQSDHIINELAAGLAGNGVVRRARRTRGTVTARTTVVSGDLVHVEAHEAEAGAGYLGIARSLIFVGTRTATNDISGNWQFQTRPPGAGATERRVFELKDDANVVVGTQAAALATTAVAGFLHIPTCAGTPTGVPTLYTGCVPMVYDTTNNRLYVYSGGAWRIH